MYIYLNIFKKGIRLDYIENKELKKFFRGRKVRCQIGDWDLERRLLLLEGIRFRELLKVIFL